jgi:tetratricopeptide (TPR) repeat protein
MAPRDHELYLARGLVYLIHEQPQKTIGDCTRAIQLKPEEPIGYELRARVYEALGKPDQAKADREKAKQLKDAATIPSSEVGRQA